MLYKVCIGGVMVYFVGLVRFYWFWRYAHFMGNGIKLA